ncbi:MAG: single-stranded DNA-binding protein [Gaiellales bacterium]
MNIVALVGNLATDPELRKTSGGRAVCSFRIAISRPSGEQADFFTVVCWERQAEVCKEYLSIGRRVAIDGRLHHSSWDAEDGSKRSKVEVIAHRVEMLGPATRRTDETSAPDPAHASETAETSSDFAIA